MELSIDFLNNTMERLSSYRPIFHSESDLQHELALIIANESNKKIRLEKPFLNIPLNKSKSIKIELDLFLPNEKVGIELKYKTIKRNIKFSDEEFFLKNHAAQNLGRFDFFDDLRRLQMLRKQGIIHSGFVIFLTNDPLYWTRIQRSNFSSNFSMEEGRVIEKNTALSWVGNPSENSVTPKRLGEHANIEIENELCLTWKTYSEFEESLFKHLIVQI
jgi:hypothetical protein